MFFLETRSNRGGGSWGEPKNEISPFTPHDILEMLSNIEKRDRKEVGGPPSIALFLSHDIDKKHLRISLLK